LGERVRVRVRGKLALAQALTPALSLREREPKRHEPIT
jgi:hypothetical protein